MRMSLFTILCFASKGKKKRKKKVKRKKEKGKRIIRSGRIEKDATCILMSISYIIIRRSLA